MFEAKIDLARDCVGMNAILLRSPSVSAYKNIVWEMPGTRERVEDFCMERVRQIIDLIDPEKLVFIGLGTLKLFKGPTPVDDIRNEENRVLTRTGQVGNHRAIAFLHLTPAKRPLSASESSSYSGQGIGLLDHSDTGPSPLKPASNVRFGPLADLCSALAHVR